MDQENAANYVKVRPCFPITLLVSSIESPLFVGWTVLKLLISLHIKFGMHFGVLVTFAGYQILWFLYLWLSLFPIKIQFNKTELPTASG